MIAGIAVMVSDSFGANVSPVGDSLALLIAVTFAGATVITRRHSGVRMTPAVTLGCMIGTAIGFSLSGGLAVSAHDAAFLVLFGAFNLGLGLALFVTGARLVPSAIAALISTLEPVLGPIWVWIVHNEVPAARTLAGGAHRVCGADGTYSLAMANEPPHGAADPELRPAQPDAAGGSRARNSYAAYSLIFSRLDERFLRDLDLAELAHALLTGLLLVEKLALAGGVAAIAFWPSHPCASPKWSRARSPCRQWQPWIGILNMCRGIRFLGASRTMARPRFSAAERCTSIDSASTGSSLTSTDMRTRSPSL